MFEVVCLGNGDNRDAGKGGVPRCGGGAEQRPGGRLRSVGKWVVWRKARFEVLHQDDRGLFEMHAFMLLPLSYIGVQERSSTGRSQSDPVIVLCGW